MGGPWAWCWRLASCAPHKPLVLNDIAPERSELALRGRSTVLRPAEFGTVAELEVFFRSLYEPFGPLADEEWNP